MNNVMNKTWSCKGVIVFGLLISLFVTSVARATKFVENPMVEHLDAAGYNIFDVNDLDVNDLDVDGDLDVTGIITTADIITKGPWKDVCAYASFSAAIVEINDTEVTLLIPDSQVVDANETVKPNITLWFLRGGELNISDGNTVTINGPVKAGLHKIFAGAGDVSFGSGCYSEVYPQWWGAKGDGSTDDTAALQAAFNSIASAEYLGTGQRLVIPPGLYDFNDTLTLDENFAILECHGTLKWTSDANIVAVMIGSSDSKWGIRASLRLHHDPYTWSTGATGIQVKNLQDSYITIERCVGFETGLQLVGDSEGTAWNQFTLGYMAENKIAVDFKLLNYGWVNENSFYGGRFSNYSGGGQTSGYAGSRFVNIPHYATHRINNNRFYSPCFECNFPNSQPEYFVYCAGISNAFIHPRNEGTASIKNVCFDGNSIGNVWMAGTYQWDLSTFTDDGSQNRIETRSITNWGNFDVLEANDLKVKDDLTVSGQMAVGTSLDSAIAANIIANGSTKYKAVNSAVVYSGSAQSVYGVYADAWASTMSNTNPRAYGGRFTATNYKVTNPSGVMQLIGGDFRVKDYLGETYTRTGSGQYIFRGGEFYVVNAVGDWTTNNPPVTTYGVHIVDEPTGYGSNHTHYSIYSAGGQSVHAGNLTIGSTSVPTCALDVTGSAKISADLDVTGSYKTNGTAGWSGWFDDGANFRVSVTNGIITAVTDSVAGGHGQ